MYSLQLMLLTICSTNICTVWLKLWLVANSYHLNNLAGRQTFLKIVCQRWCLIRPCDCRYSNETERFTVFLTVGETYCAQRYPVLFINGNGKRCRIKFSTDIKKEIMKEKEAFNVCSREIYAQNFSMQCLSREQYSILSLY